MAVERGILHDLIVESLRLRFGEKQSENKPPCNGFLNP